MPDAHDMDLVREFASDNSEAAFTELVRRHINLVYSVARRCTGNDGDAHDVTQAVFIILARKAAGLREKTLLTGWLYETTRFAAARLLRTNARRHAREQEAYMQSTLNEADTAAVWTQLSPHLEAAMSKLAAADRALLVLRFYENKSGPEAAALLGIREDAAHKRMARAIEKLRKFFAQRGVTLSGAAIAGAVSANSVQTTPVALVKTISVVAVAKGAAATTSTLTLVKGALKIMAWTKIKTAIVVGVYVLLATATTTVVVHEVNNHGAYYKGKTLKQWLVDLDDQHPGPANDKAIEAVHHFGTNGLPTIIGLLKMSDKLHHSAVLACYELGPDAKPAITALVELLKSGYTGGYVTAALCRVGADAVPTLLDLATNRINEARTGYVQLEPGRTQTASSLYMSVRVDSLGALGNILAYSSNALANYDISPALITCLNDSTPVIRSFAARALGFITNDEATVVPALIPMLNDRDFQTRWSTCLALGNYGKRAEAAILALRNALADKNSYVRACAAIALVQIEPDNAAQINSLMPILTENINGIGGNDFNFRSTTADALALCGDKAKRAVPALLKAVQNTSSYEQQEILDALKKIDPVAAASTGLK
jgi:RNA polymerase sigma factor (sigma-70 family)